MSTGDNDKNIADIKKTVVELRKQADTHSDDIKLKTETLEKLQSENVEAKDNVEILMKRVESLEAETGISTDNLCTAESSFDTLNKIYDDNESWRKELEKKQTENEERVEEMSLLIKTVTESTELTSSKYDEAHVKLMKTTENIGKLTKRIDDAKKKIDEKEKEMKVKLAQYKKMQSNAEERRDKESKREAHLNELRKQVAAAESRADKAEADLRQKRADIDRLHGRLKVESDTVNNLRKDKVKMSSEYKKL